MKNSQIYLNFYARSLLVSLVLEVSFEDLDREHTISIIGVSKEIDNPQKILDIIRSMNFPIEEMPPRISSSTLGLGIPSNFICKRIELEQFLVNNTFNNKEYNLYLIGKVGKIEYRKLVQSILSNVDNILRMVEK